MIDDVGKTWNEILDLIGARVNKDNFERWFAAARLKELNDTTLVVVVPNQIHEFWIEINFMGIVQDSITKVLGAPRTVEFVCGQGDDSAAESNGGHGAEPNGGNGMGSLAGVPGAVRPAGNGGTGRQADGTDESPEKEAAKRRRMIESKLSAAGLDRHQSFSSFVVGPNNDVAAAACLAAANKRGQRYSPLFVHGSDGMGKTHLLHAIGGAMIEAHPRSRVLYVTSEKFTNDFIDALQQGELVKFRRRYRDADVLLIDDIQFFGGKERSQEEFFHTFNALLNGHRQIVMTCDRPVSEVADLQSRLVSRCQWGLAVELEPPEFEMRMAILKKKTGEMAIHVDDGILEYLAYNICDSVRRLEGALKGVAAYISVRQRDGSGNIPREDIEKLVRDYGRKEREPSIQEIQKRVARHFDLRVSDLTGRRRTAGVALGRQVAMYLARTHTRASLKVIGDAFGGRDHGTVIHACKAIDRKAKESSQLRADLADLKAELDAGSPS